MITRQVCGILYGAAKAGWTHHCAVGATQASIRNILPARISRITVEKAFDLGCVHCPPHLSDGPRHGPLNNFLLFITCRFMRDVLKDFRAASRTDFDDKVMLPVLKYLRQSEVKPGSRSRPCT